MVAYIHAAYVITTLMFENEERDNPPSSSIDRPGSEVHMSRLSAGN